MSAVNRPLQHCGRVETVLRHQLSTEQLRQCVNELLPNPSSVCPHYASCLLGAAAQAGLQVPADQLQPLLGGLLQQGSEANAGAIARALHVCARSQWHPLTWELGLLLTRFADQLPDVSVQDTGCQMSAALVGCELF